MKHINEYLLSKNKQKIEDYSKISDQLDDKFKDHLSDIYKKDNYIYIEFEHIKPNNDGLVYTYIESDKEVWYSRLSLAKSKPKEGGGNWFLLYTNSNDLSSYKRIGYLINKDLERKLNWDEIKL